MYPDVKEANGACNSAACYLVRHDSIDVLQATWEAALANLVIDLRQRVKEKRSGTAEKIGLLWWYTSNAAWAPLQIRDHWLLFSPRLGRQQRKFGGSTLQSSKEEFERTGWLEVAPDTITTDIN
jgi:hypothetical protein